MSQAASRGVARFGFVSKVVLAAYVLTAALLPLGHHDIACHLKSSSHCVTCVVGSSGETASPNASIVTTSLEDSGRAYLRERAPVQSVVFGGTRDRSPPVAA